MRTALRIVSLASLIVLIAPSILFLAGRMDLDRVKWVMIVATVLWFATATPVMWNSKEKAEQSDA
jgi:hypothetical protein